MLAAMNDRSFVVVYAYIKTEPVQAALFGLIFLGDVVTPGAGRAILIATAGVVIMALKPGASIRTSSATLLGLASGAHVRALGGRLSRRDPEPGPAELRDGGDLHAVRRAAACRRRCCRSICGCATRRARRHLRAWRPSLFAGFMGALASQFWFLAFALATAASVRTLALVEVLFAQAISRFVFKQPTSRARSRRHRADRGRAS